MMIEVQIDPPYRRLVDPDLVREAAAAALGPSEGELTVRIGSEAAIRNLNRRFMGLDEVTDILSFPAAAPGAEDPYLGDIFIAYPQAERQAQAGGHAVDKELQLLVVHGVLHLLGHDHEAAAQKQRMWAVQSEILHRLGNTLSPP